LEALKANYNVDVQWHSFELRPAGTPPLSEEYRASIAAKRHYFHQAAQEQYGVMINEGPFGIDSRPALVGAKYAEAQGVGEAYHEAVFRSYWQEAKSIEEIDVLADIATDIGLERQAFVAALDEEMWDTAVSADVYQARVYGLSGVPAMVFANKYLVVGAQPYNVLAQVVERVNSEIE
jgi:predicted DsbA family dithiol-disulfide isomerase